MRCSVAAAAVDEMVLQVGPAEGGERPSRRAGLASPRKKRPAGRRKRCWGYFRKEQTKEEGG
jgi:hypothetical protein